MLNPDNWEQVINMVSPVRHRRSQAGAVVFRIRQGSGQLSQPCPRVDELLLWEREKANIDEVVASTKKGSSVSTSFPEGTVDDSLTRKVFKASGHKPVARARLLASLREGARRIAL